MSIFNSLLMGCVCGKETVTVQNRKFCVRSRLAEGCIFLVCFTANKHEVRSIGILCCIDVNAVHRRTVAITDKVWNVGSEWLNKTAAPTLDDDFLIIDGYSCNTGIQDFFVRSRIFHIFVSGVGVLYVFEEKRRNCTFL